MPRRLLITADDFGVGPATSAGILELAARGRITSAVLLANSPFAEDGVRRWERAGKPMELGWHPCLTMDAPVRPAAQLPSLTDSAGRFLPLGVLSKKLLFDRVHRSEIAAELAAQLQRFVELVGHPPTTVNAHHHLHVFRPVGDALLNLLAGQTPKPFVRRVREPWRTLLRVPGVRLKRLVLCALGRRAARRQAKAGFPGNDALLGVTDPPLVADPDFFARWLREARGEVCELMVHPGHADGTLGDRDGPASGGQAERRVREFELLSSEAFPEAVRVAGFDRVADSRRESDGG